MLYSRPQDNEESQYLQSTQGDKTTDNRRQHGTYSNSHLLGIPSETLTGITSYLDPSSLYSLARVNTILYRHMEEDNTWRRAFASRYLGIGPENDLCDNTKSILLRRSERTWKNELIARFKIERKWKTSRSTSVSHVPVPSAISHIHLMSGQLVLSSCLQYGIVARSLPLNGKVYGGYLSAAANGIGIGGIGNPNMEFVPNASTCAVTSRGSSASLLWGFVDGSVAVVLAEKVMNPRRITAELRRCNPHEEHQGIVSDSAWDDEALTATTGGMDGQVKLWNADPLVCVWASKRQVRDLVADPCVKVAISMNQPKGSIVAAFHSGKVCVWTGFQIAQDHDITAQVREFQIPCPLRELDQEDNSTVLPTVTSLLIDLNNEAIVLLIAYKDHPFFYRVELGGVDNSIETTAFGDPSFGPITTVSPFFASQSDLGSFVITGDSLGCISIYDWRSVLSSQDPVKPIRKFEAHEDGAAVTAIGWNGMTLMTGSSRAAIHVWDGLSFAHLRSFVLQPRRHRHRPHDNDSNDEAIKQIIIDSSREMFVACAGDRVLAWRAGPLAPISYSKRRAPSGARHVARRGRSGYAKYLEQVDIKETIKETRHVMEQEHKAFKHTINKEKEHRAQLDKLGLTEAEAIEYAMMLSLEDAADSAALDALQATDSTASNSSMTTEDVFDIDEAPDEGTPSSSSYRSLSPASSSTASDHTWDSSSLSHLGSPASQREVVPQNVSGPELQASSSTSFVASISSLSSAVSLASGSPSPTSQPNPTLIEAHFPPIATGARAGGSTNSCAGSSSPAHRKAHGTFSNTSSSGRGSTIHDEIIAMRSVDSFVKAAPNSSNSIPKGTKSWSSVAGSCTAPSIPPGRSATRRFRPVGAGAVRYTPSAFHATNDAELDEDLRYALELSLAEAKGRGEAPPA